MKNPFRTRVALERTKILPDYLEIEKGDSVRWAVIYRKWYQRHWHYFEMESTGIGYCKMPKYHKSKEEAIASVKAYKLN